MNRSSSRSSVIFSCETRSWTSLRSSVWKGHQRVLKMGTRDTMPFFWLAEPPLGWNLGVLSMEAPDFIPWPPDLTWKPRGLEPIQSVVHSPDPERMMTGLCRGVECHLLAWGTMRTNGKGNHGGWGWARLDGGAGTGPRSSRARVLPLSLGHPLLQAAPGLGGLRSPGAQVLRERGEPGPHPPFALDGIFGLFGPTRLGSFMVLWGPSISLDRKYWAKSSGTLSQSYCHRGQRGETCDMPYSTGSIVSSFWRFSW